MLGMSIVMGQSFSNRRRPHLQEQEGQRVRLLEALLHSSSKRLELLGQAHRLPLRQDQTLLLAAMQAAA